MIPKRHIKPTLRLNMPIRTPYAERCLGFKRCCSSGSGLAVPAERDEDYAALVEREAVNE